MHQRIVAKNDDMERNYETDKRRPNLEKIPEEAEKEGVAVQLLVFEGFGHKFPGEYHPQVREWLEEKVINRK